MKRFIVTTAATALVALASYGQGTISFKNYFGNVNTDPAVFLHDGITKVSHTATNYIVALMAGPSAASLTQVATTRFLSAATADGFFQAGTVSIPTVAGGTTAFLQIEVWDTTLGNTTTGATFDQATAWGVTHSDAWGWSSVFSVTTGNPTGNPPTTPTLLQGVLTSFSLNNVPEPSSFALIGLGGAALTIFRRRSK